MTPDHPQVIQCGRNPQQEWRTPILHRPTSPHRITAHTPMILPDKPGRKQSHIRISLVRSHPTTHRLETRMDRPFSITNYTPKRRCSKSSIYPSYHQPTQIPAN